MTDTEKVHPPKRPDGFSWADDVVDADRECGLARAIRREVCVACRRPVMLHCDHCKIQVTGCLCTLVERMSPIEAFKMMARDVGQTKAREAMMRLGYNMPFLPDPNLPL